MGSSEILSFNGYEIIYNKNRLSCSNGFGLFLPSDLQRQEEETGHGTVKNYPTYVRKMSVLKDRLDLMGYTLTKAEIAIKESIHPEITLSDFLEMLSHINFNQEKSYQSIDSQVTETSLRFENFGLAGYILENTEAAKILQKYRYENDWQEDWPPLDPFLELRCFAELDKFSGDTIVWDYYELVQGGWIKESDVQVLGVSPMFLVLTEGKTDTDIIEKALKMFRSDIQDFFLFVDTENHPFGGAKDIVKFVKGLVDIKYAGSVLVILDNDLAGLEAMEKIQSYNLPENFNVKTLPNLNQFEEIETLGTNGSTRMDINGKAVSIECFLDLTSINENPSIRWTNWDENKKEYHGRFDQRIKNQLKIKFDDAIEKNDTNYDFSKLKILIDFIVDEAKNMKK